MKVNLKATLIIPQLGLHNSYLLSANLVYS